MNERPALLKLKQLALQLGVTDLANEVLDIASFNHWSASSKPHKHHYGTHGLVIHTLDVVQLCLLNNNHFDNPVEPAHLFLAALFHDVGKLYDYKPVAGQQSINGQTEWEAAPHRYMIHHIPRSFLIWEKAKEKHGFHDPEDTIAHAILAHHGRKEWSSPVEPKTKMAWLLHLSDLMSARMEDCDKNRGPEARD